jgi:type IV pilus assembly protein PilM
MEIGKLLPVSTEQVETRYIRLDQNEGAYAHGKKAKEIDAGQAKGESVLLLAVPSATVYQYHSIFSRAGLTVTAFDLQAFALWRVFGRDIFDTAAIIDIGEKASQLVVVKDSSIRFIRLLPVGGETLTRAIMDTFSVDNAQAQKLKEEASIARDSETSLQGGASQRVDEALREGLTEFIKEVRRSLNFCSTQDGLSVERIILSGGTSRLGGIANYCQEMLGLRTEIGVARTVPPEQSLNLRPYSKGNLFDVEADLPEQKFDPVYAVALGLAMRGIES